MEISDGRDEIKLVVVIAEMRRDADMEEGRIVKELRYGLGSSLKSSSLPSSGSMLGSASSSPGSDISELKDIPSSYAIEGEGGSLSSGSS
jgi:hypothetical protein